MGMSGEPARGKAKNQRLRTIHQHSTTPQLVFTRPKRPIGNFIAGGREAKPERLGAHQDRPVKSRALERVRNLKSETGAPGQPGGEEQPVAPANNTRRLE
jgi:hypothetical protein